MLINQVYSSKYSNMKPMKLFAYFLKLHLF